ncbi:VOC family protein [Telmatobacter sp. DSM 110680]|uniref:VOC family protein n=1 Tax=Telmatobacter sp. DSM 110680 TaxID=3036704 RepID=A0AAU7DJ27_9BACT
MINGIHLLLYSRDPEADRAFFRDVLGFSSVDAGEGWLIFALPPAEMGIHRGDGKFVEHHADHDLSGSVIYLMCDDLRATMDSLKSKGAETTEIVQAGWGITTTVRLPGGGGLGLYQPRHATALDLGRN